MIIGIGHTAYVVADMKASMRFYCDQLGFKHAFSTTDSEGRPWIEYLKIAPGQFIELFYASGEIPPQNGSYRHLCLQVDDIQETARALEAAGVTLRVKPQQGRDTNWQCWADDPDGNPIEFMQINPSSPQARA